MLEGSIGWAVLVVIIIYFSIYLIYLLIKGVIYLMGIFCPKRTQVFNVTVHVDGRHPYLSKEEQKRIGENYDKPTRDVVVTVPAKDWNDAEKQAFTAIMKSVKGWGYSIRKIERAGDFDETKTI